MRISAQTAVVSTIPTEVYLEEETDIDKLLAALSGTNLTFNEEELRWVSRLLGWRTFKKGHYQLEGEYSYDEFLTKLALGSQDPVSITILPGITIERFSRNVAYTMQFDSSEIASLFNDEAFLEEKGLNKEQLFGRMLPNTYDVYWTNSAQSVIERVLREFDSIVNQAYGAKADSLGYAIDEIVTMASIVEWEANIESEKPIVSGLYWNRLKNRMYLQADPTINYAVGERRRLLLQDYKVGHPFNTYTNFGLPPGPVTNPSLSTIKATLYPDEHDYIYMVANPEGGHVFNVDYEDHLRDSETWRRWLRKQYRIKRQRESQQTTASF